MKVKLKSTKDGLEVHQIIDGWLFTTVIPPDTAVHVVAYERRKADEGKGNGHKTR